MTAERARLFVALELPDDVRDALVSWRAGALRGGPELRLIAAEHLHVTRCFLGWQGVGEVEPIAQACASAAADAAPARLALGTAVWLPPRRPRVLATEVVDPGGALGALQAVLSAALQSGGWYEPERRPFLPHVTVARVRAGTPVGSGPPEPPPPLGFTGSQVMLYRSHLARAGARYEALAGISTA